MDDDLYKRPKNVISQILNEFAYLAVCAVYITN